MFKDIAQAKLNIDFDHRLFSLEYDKLILPHKRPITNSKMSWERTRELNKTWKMVDPEIYDKCSIETSYANVDPREIPQWDMVQLMYFEVNEDDPVHLKNQVHYGGVSARNMGLDRDWKIKPQFEKLKIVEFIKKLPFKKMVGIHCVSLEPGSFASIHRDSRWFPEFGKANNLHCLHTCHQTPNTVEHRHH